MPTWEPTPLRSHISEAGIDVQRRLAILESVARYVNIFRFHLWEARDAMKDVVEEDNPHGIRNLLYIFGDAENQHEFERAKIASEAHILASIHSARSIWDVFAFLVNSVALDSAISERECDLRKVWKRLPESTLRIQIGELLESEWFEYITAFINTSKHRYLVPHAFHVSFENGRSEIRIGGFTYNGKTFPEHSARHVIAGLLVVQNQIVECGQALDSEVAGGTV
jgi:hypothetical protein